MNLPVENLNQLGNRFLELAWPMLWQSSLLIAALFAFDVWLRRRVRAAVRYALWLIVLVKLVLPPTLALPTSPAWWLHHDPVAVQVSPQFKNYTVSYDSTPLPTLPLNALPVPVAPALVLTLATCLSVISVIICFGLLVYLLMRWWQITQQVRRAETSKRLATLVVEAQKNIGMKSFVPVKLTANAMSPAVCGLFRPAILIPQTLAENFSDEQLRAVLLHELIHLQRGDVWLNFFQSLLQIVYWWHPLVWLANTRIRRVREEAVDDAVMLALAGEAETYAPTLLEVAKLALNRPLASLGLVGILESRSALRQRIERLVDFRPPRRAGLTLVSLAGILAFTAVAVPMGSAPAPTENQPASVSVPVTGIVDGTGRNTSPAQVFIEAGFYQMSAADFQKTVSDLKFNPADQSSNSWWSASPEAFNQLAGKLKTSGLQAISRPRIQADSGQPAQFYVGNGTNGLELDCLPLVTNGLIDLTIQSLVIEASVNLLITNQFVGNVSVENHGGFVFRINNAAGQSNMVAIVGVKILPEVGATNVAGILTNPNFQKALEALQQRTGVETTNEPEVVIASGRRQSIMAVNTIPSTFAALQDKLTDGLAEQNNPNATGVVSNRIAMSFRINYPKDYASLKKLFLAAGVKMPPTAIVYNDNNSGLLLATGTKEQLSIVYRVVMKLNDVSPSDSDANIRRFLAEHTEWVETNSAATNLFERIFKLDMRVFAAQLKNQTGLPVDSAKNISAAARAFFSSIGVDLKSPKGKAVFCNDRNGLLLVKATEMDLDLIERTVQTLVQVPPQIHIKARFIEVPKTSNGNDSSLYLGQIVTNGPVDLPVSPSANSPVGSGFPGGIASATAVANTTPSGKIGILNHEQLKAVLQMLQERGDAITLAEPEAVTISGRQVQMRATQIITLITNFALQEIVTNLSVDFVSSKMETNRAIIPQTAQVEAGPVLDVIPYVLSDGYTINLTAIPSLTRFLGYNTPPANSVENVNDGRVHLPVILPEIHVQRSVATVNLLDNQTVVFSGLKEHAYVNGKEKPEKPKADGKELLVFLTVTIVDPAGNRIHTDDEMPFAKDAIPPQPTK